MNSERDIDKGGHFWAGGERGFFLDTTESVPVLIMGGLVQIDRARRIRLRILYISLDAMDLTSNGSYDLFYFVVFVL